MYLKLLDIYEPIPRRARLPSQESLSKLLLHFKLLCSLPLDLWSEFESGDILLKVVVVPYNNCECKLVD